MGTSPPSSRTPPGPRFPLSLKLATVLASLAIPMIGFLLFYFGPHTTDSFLKRSDRLITMSSDEMRRLVRENTQQSTRILVDLILHTTDARRRHLEDLPLSLYSGDIERIREAIAREDEASSERLQRNASILAREMEARSQKEVHRRLEELTQEQTRMGDTFAESLRSSFLLLSGGILLGLVLLLGIGLYHTVVNPIRRLRRVTQSITRGDLQIEVPLNSRDEVGDLAIDFSAMLQELRISRQAVKAKNLELEELNRNLETEVTRKTQHLETALDDLRRTQKQLLHAEKMASIGKLAGGVAHEFNNLIGGIRGCAQEILETETDGDRRETLEVVLRAANRATQITDQLLRFSRQRALHMSAVPIVSVIDEALLLIEADARQRKIDISTDIQSRPELYADSDALHQVFLNLATNALQAMKQGGRLEVSVSTTTRDVSVRFQDTGVGIPTENQDKIFEPFFTTKDRETDPFLRGSGLGLSVCYSLVEAHGGSITVESSPGKGTGMIVTLPLGFDKPTKATIDTSHD